MKKYLKLIPFIFILLFASLFYSYQNGYYEKYMRDKTILTNYKIEEFENDIKEGKDITLNKYLKDEKSYATKTSNMSLKISNKIENIINKGIKYFFKKVANYVE